MNPSEFERRIAELHPRLLAIARKKLPPDECEDAVQSAVLAAWEHLPQLRDEARFDGWVYRILINQCRQSLRRLRRERAHSQPLDGPQEPQAGQASMSAAHSALEALDADDKKLLLLHHVQGYSLEELAKMTGKSEGALGTRLYRARKRLRLALISLLLLALLAAAAIAADRLGVNWFLLNRRASKVEPYEASGQKDSSLTYSGTLLRAEVSDVIWDTEGLSLLFTYSLAGTDADALTVHSGDIGVDGERLDHIWVDGGILPVEAWAQGRPVRVYSLDGWRIGDLFLIGSEDFLMDGLGESFFAELQLDRLKPELYGTLLDEEGMLSLTCDVTVRDYDSGEPLEKETLTLRVSAPNPEAWRKAYEAFFD